MKVLIDNGHGLDTPGKRSPDGSVREWSWTREVARAIVDSLRSDGIDASLLTPEDEDIPLADRVRRVNAQCAILGSKNVVLVSVHINAAGADGKWHTARGWSGWVSPNASSGSKRLAQLLFDEADIDGLRGNRSVPPCRYWVGNFSIVRHTYCPAVLTENLFMDNMDDAAILLSDEGKKKIVGLHCRAIKKYMST